MSFLKPQEVEKQIQSFNNKLHTSIPRKKLFYYGLDRGKEQQATLCMTQEDPASNKEVSFAPVEVWKLKEEYYDHKWDDKHLAFKNLSYVMQKNNLFEIKRTATIDLTTAKLIKGKIVENGDICTYLKFKEFHAKKLLFENRQYIKENKIFTSDDQKMFYIKDRKEENISIYYFRDKFKKILSIDHIKNELQEYLQNIDNNPKALINKVHHLNSAIANNIVGILSFIYVKNPGLIILERDQKRKIESIAKDLEWALYRRFQTEGLVPPRLRAVDLLVKNIQNLGCIYFIDHQGTSQKCPNCSKTPMDKEKFKANKAEGWFLCEHCQFDTRNPIEDLQYLEDPDKLAAYNICHIGREKFKKKP